MKRGLVSRRVPERESKRVFNKWVLILLLIIFASAILILLFKSSPPQILSASVYPEKVTAGQAMLIKAEIKDNLIIKNVKASIETDDLPDITRLLLVDGTIRTGKYERVWIAHDTSAQKWYNITITATNLFGKIAIKIIPYQDPTQSHNASEIVGGTFTGNYTFAGGDVNVTGSMIIPIGTTAQRPGTPATGMVRFNTNTIRLEFYNGSNWKTITIDSINASGGTITTSGGYTIHTFTSSGTFAVTGSGYVEVLVVGGGGGGGGNVGGGGGAGGFRTNNNYAVSDGNYVVTVGGGGAGGAASTSGSNGSDSIFGTITSAGGGGGGVISVNGATGGSGGGGGGGLPTGTGGAGNTPSTNPSQGNSGGNGFYGGSPNYYPGGGGGGASAAGINATNLGGGDGGTGTASSISGSSVTYSGGGGGGTENGGTKGTGGAGGGGAGGQQGTDATAGTANTGGGGGGGKSGGNGASGGSGIVIVRYLQ